MPSRAVLVGAWDYQHLQPVPAARNSLTRMRALLTGPLCDWPTDRVTVIGNRATPGDLHDQLIELYSDTEADGVALFYFVGHGQPDDQDRLCLGLAGSRTDYHRRASTSLRFDDVRGALTGCAAQTKIVMLDCCFAGLAARPQQSLSDAAVLDLVRGTGAYTMAASGAYLPAWFETDAEAPQTYFTKYFVDVVEKGIAGQPAGLTLDRIFTETAANLVRDRKPEPTHTARHEAGRTVFARNAVPVEEQLDRDAEIARLRAELSKAREVEAELRARDLANERRLRARPDKADDDQELDPVERAAGASASLTVAAEAERAEKAEALRELVVMPDVPDKIGRIAAAGLVPAVFAMLGTDEFRSRDEQVHTVLTTMAQRPVAEVVELITKLFGSRRSNRYDDIDTIMRWAALRPLPDVVALATAVSAGVDEPRTLVLRLMRWVVHRPIEDLVKLMVELGAAEQETAVGYLAAHIGAGEPRDVLLTLGVLRGAELNKAAAKMLLMAGRKEATVAELVDLLVDADRDEDVLVVLLAARNRSPESRIALEARLERTDIPASRWRPLL